MSHTEASKNYINVIKDMYDIVFTIARAIGIVCIIFPIL